MSAPVRYTLHHPRWYRRPVSVFWWLESRAYIVFVLRELTSVFVALVSVLTLLQVRAILESPEAHAALMARLASPPVTGLLLVALAALVFHSVSWFNLAPRAMPVRLRGRRVPDVLVSGGNFAAWLFLSAAMAFLFLGR
jgi:fumarate reductase subunit C